MKKIIVCVVSAIITIAGISGKVLTNNQSERPSSDILQVTEKNVNEETKEIIEKMMKKLQKKKQQIKKMILVLKKVILQN